MNMKKLYEIFKNVLCNTILILSIVLTVMFILDIYNPMIGFLSDGLAKLFLLILLISCIVYSLISIVETAKKQVKSQEQSCEPPQEKVR